MFYSSLFAGPGDAPNNFTVMISMTSLWYRWAPPTVRNGIITNYLLDAVRTQTLGASVFSYLLCGLSAGQSVTANIRASTVVGAGPQQTLMNMTTAQGILMSHIQPPLTASQQSCMFLDSPGCLALCTGAVQLSLTLYK